MRGGMFSKAGNNKTKTPRGLLPPSPPRRVTNRDIERQVYRSADAFALLPPIRNTPTNLERLLRSARIDERIAQSLTYKEQQQLEADLSGLAAGRTAGTMPERLTASWLVQHGYSYGGQSYNFKPSADWGFQVPLAGGRNAAGGGAVADIFLNAKITNAKTGLGTVVRVNGAYWHLRADNESRDAAQALTLKAKGYVVDDLWDYEALSHGALDAHMTRLLGSGHR